MIKIKREPDDDGDDKVNTDTKDLDIRIEDSFNNVDQYSSYQNIGNDIIKEELIDIDEDKDYLNHFLASKVTIDKNDITTSNTDEQLDRVAINDDSVCPESQTTSNANNILKCKFCNKSFTKKYKLNVHLNSHSRAKSFQCDTCGKLVVYKARLDDPLNKHSVIREFKCENCNKLFIFKCNNSNKKFKCKVCNKTFARKHTLTAHLKIHSRDSKGLRCKICNKRFLREISLDGHLRQHFIYKCEICNDSFMRKVSLDQHLKEHSTVKEFRCEICDKVLLSKSHLDQHLTQHSGAKEVESEICNETNSIDNSELPSNERILQLISEQLGESDDKTEQHNNFAKHLATELNGVPAEMIHFVKRIINLAIFEGYMKNLNADSSIITPKPQSTLTSQD